MYYDNNDNKFIPLARTIDPFNNIIIISLQKQEFMIL